MPRFLFPLQPVLKVRRHAERQRQRTVAVLEQERLRLEGLLQSQQAHLVEGKDDLRLRLRGAIDVTALRWQAVASAQVMRQAQRIALELAGLHQRLESARGDLVAAARERRAVELLRAQRWEEWRAADRKRETAALDEIAGRHAYRKESDR